MPGILSGARGASCQLCTATYDQVKERVFVIQVFPINRHIPDVLELFGELEAENHYFLFLLMTE